MAEGKMRKGEGEGRIRLCVVVLLKTEDAATVGSVAHTDDKTSPAGRNDRNRDQR